MFLSRISLIDAFLHHPLYVGTRRCSSWNFCKYRQSLSDETLYQNFFVNLVIWNLKWIFFFYAWKTKPSEVYLTHDIAKQIFKNLIAMCIYLTTICIVLTIYLPSTILLGTRYMLYTILYKIYYILRYMDRDQLNTHSRSSRGSNSSFCFYPSIIT